MIKLMFLSYVDRKKLTILFIFELLVILFTVLIVYEKDSAYDMMLDSNYYLTYIHQVFTQVFLIVNAMFVLFLVMDHDQKFLKPLISFFGRLKVSLYKYLFFELFIIIYGLFVMMIYIVIVNILTPLNLQIDLYTYSYMFLDMMLICNMILLIIKQKYKSLAIIILMIYIFISLFTESIGYQYTYILPIYQVNKNYQILELYYKICYIFLGFMIYLLKSLKEQV